MFIPCQCLPYEICSAYNVYHSWSLGKKSVSYLPFALSLFCFMPPPSSVSGSRLVFKQGALGKERLGRTPCISGGFWAPDTCGRDFRCGAGPGGGEPGLMQLGERPGQPGTVSFSSRQMCTRLGSFRIGPLYLFRLFPSHRAVHSPGAFEP